MLHLLHWPNENFSGRFPSNFALILLADLSFAGLSNVGSGLKSGVRGIGGGIGSLTSPLGTAFPSAGNGQWNTRAPSPQQIHIGTIPSPKYVEYSF